MARFNLTFRAAAFAEQTEEVEVALVTFEHPDLAEPMRVSSDATERLSVDPLKYGTRSRGLEYDFVLMSIITPDDNKNAPPRNALVLDNVGAQLVELLRSFSSPATATMELVLASSPDFVMRTFRLRIVRASYDETTVTLDMVREPFTNEPNGQRMTRNFFPGLFGIAAA